MSSTEASVAVTVVVPTRDRPEHLASCLEALAAQRADDFEIVVVDDASHDADAVARVAAPFPRARLLRAAGAGPAAARNLGAAAARGRVLCFTDDDCRPGPDWVEGLRARIDAGAAAVAGPTRNGRPDNPYSTASQLLTNHLSATSRSAESPAPVFAPTSNLGVRRDVFAELPFDDTYPLAAGEDREWCERLASTGRALHYAPEAWVTHHQDLEPRGFWRQQVRYGRGGRRLRADGIGAYQPARFYLGVLGAGFAAGPAVGSLVVLAQAATLAGVALESLDAARANGGRYRSRRG